MGKTLLKIGPRDAGMHLTREAFASADMQPPYRYERANGKLVVMPPPGPEHRHPARLFNRKLCVYWDRHPDVIDFVDVEGWSAIGEDTDRIPDICVCLAGPASGSDVPDRVPDLVFEIVSEGWANQERDYIDKRAEYHAIGVREYVIVDRFKQQVLVLTWAADDFTEKTLGPNETYTTALLPGLAVALSEVFCV